LLNYAYIIVTAHFQLFDWRAYFLYIQEEVSVSKKKREYRKRKHKSSTSQQPNQNTNAQPVYNNTEHLGMLQSDLYSSDEDVLSPVRYFLNG
jgi:hypothetical protein